MIKGLFFHGIDCNQKLVDDFLRKERGIYYYSNKNEVFVPLKKVAFEENRLIKYYSLPMNKEDVEPFVNLFNSCYVQAFIQEDFSRKNRNIVLSHDFEIIKYINPFHNSNKIGRFLVVSWYELRLFRKQKRWILEGYHNMVDRVVNENLWFISSIFDFRKEFGHKPKIDDIQKALGLEEKSDISPLLLKKLRRLIK